MPVGEATSTSPPSRMAGQASCCGLVGPPGNRDVNQLATAGWKSERTGSATGVGSVVATSETSLRVWCDARSRSARLGCNEEVPSQSPGWSGPWPGERRGRGHRPEGVSPPIGVPPRVTSIYIVIHHESGPTYGWRGAPTLAGPPLGGQALRSRRRITDRPSDRPSSPQSESWVSGSFFEIQASPMHISSDDPSPQVTKWAGVPRKAGSSWASVGS